MDGRKRVVRQISIFLVILYLDVFVLYLVLFSLIIITYKMLFGAFFSLKEEEEW